MRRIPKFRPSTGTIIGLLALFVALGATSYAALNIPANSVGTQQLKRNAVVSTKVKDRSLLAKDFRAGQLPAGVQGPVGATGATGATGPTGPPGPTAAAFAHNNVESSPVPLAGFAPPVLDLSTGTGFITVSTPARLIASATAILRNTVASTQTVECRLALFPQPANTQLPFGEAGSETTEPAIGKTTTIAMTGGVSVAAGTYNIQVQCAAGAAGSTYRKGNLTVVVVGQ